METCETCKNCDQFGFCEKLVIDTRRILVENGRSIKSYYIDEREDGDDRSSFIVPRNFCCNLHSKK